MCSILADKATGKGFCKACGKHRPQLYWRQQILVGRWPQPDRATRCSGPRTERSARGPWIASTAGRMASRSCVVQAGPHRARLAGPDPRGHQWLFMVNGQSGIKWRRCKSGATSCSLGRTYCRSTVLTISGGASPGRMPGWLNPSSSSSVPAGGEGRRFAGGYAPCRSWGPSWSS
jgi:hypothetical protein